MKKFEKKKELKYLLITFTEDDKMHDFNLIVKRLVCKKTPEVGMQRYFFYKLINK